MNKQANKCRHCKKSFQFTKIDQKFCSAACRQADYRRRKTQAKKPKKQAVRREIQPLVQKRGEAICEHCKGTFWAKTRRSRFCSTSCRTMHHRAMKAAIPNALTAVYNMPMSKAADIIETQPLTKIRDLLENCGYIYSHPARQWVQQSELGAYTNG